MKNFEKSWLCANPLSTRENTEDGGWIQQKTTVFAATNDSFVDNLSPVIDKTFNFMYAQAKHVQKCNKYFDFQENREKLEREDSVYLEIVALIGGEQLLLQQKIYGKRTSDSPELNLMKFVMS